MEITLNTPALLFPTVSLILLAYTNRFLGLANVIRQLAKSYREHPDEGIYQQIQSLTRRIRIIRNMQAAGILSLFFCAVCMFLLYDGWLMAAKWVFGLALVLLMYSLLLSFKEILLSVQALTLELNEIQAEKGNN